MSVNDACGMRPACGCNATSAIRTLECLAVKLSICAIASEVVPLAKTGGLADVASALSRELTARATTCGCSFRSTRRSPRQALGDPRGVAAGAAHRHGHPGIQRRHLARAAAGLLGSAGFRRTPVLGYLIESDALYSRRGSTPPTPTSTAASSCSPARRSNAAAA